jgi:hypothetical protein
MYLMGIPVTVVVDDFLPLLADSVRKTIYAEVGEDGALWGTIFEKLYAKYFGNYEVIDAGHAASGIETAIGAPYNNIIHEGLTRDDREQLWRDLMDKGD